MIIISITMMMMTMVCQDLDDSSKRWCCGGQVMANRSENAKLHRKLRGKDAVWEELKEDTVMSIDSR
jgi:hypothetical protein